jgi:hypothetical protein
MNSNLTYAVVANENVGGMPSVVSKNSPEFWDMQQIGYAILYEDTKRGCLDFQHEMMQELNNIQFFEA